jgi:hypothetical protein
MSTWCRIGVALAAAVAVTGLASAAAPRGADTPALPLFRVILKDGTALVSLGEFTRVGDRVVFSMPLDAPRGDRLQLVNLPASVVNWETTQQYAEATRYAQYAATRGEADFAVLTGDVARALNEIALAQDAARKLQIAEQTRRALAAWPLEHLGYRSADVNDMLSLLDGTISDLRGAAGVRRFDFSLVATIQPPSMPLLPDPSPAQAIEQVILAARHSDIPAEQIALLRSALASIDAHRATLPRQWARRTRASLQQQIDAVLDVERSYEALTRSTVEKATAAAARGDVRAVEQVAARLVARDRALGGQRKDHVAGLMGLLQERLDAARRLRLVRDQWEQKLGPIRTYRSLVARPIDEMAGLRRKLEDVKALAGPDVAELSGLAHRFEKVARQLFMITPPPDLAPAHASLTSAAGLGQQAMRARARAAASADLSAAWDASSAAAGSILLLAQARRQIDELSHPPELR